MGACSEKPEHENRKQSSGVPDCFYFNRSKGNLINIHNRKIQKIPLNSRLFYSKETAIGILSRKRLMLLGGSTSKGLVSNASILNLTTLEVSPLPDIPIQCKLGQIHEIGDWVYYIGGQTYEKNELISTPIFRFSQKQSLWQEIKEPQRDGPTCKFSALKNFGSCVLDKKIFIFGGERVNKLGNLKSSKLILSLTVDQNFVLKTENKFPITVNNPVVAAGDKHALLVGGTNPKTGEFNTQCFYVLIKDKGVRVHTVDSLKMQFTENFPPIYTGDYAVFVSYPNVAVRFKNIDSWRTYHIKGKKPLKSRIEAQKSKIETVPVKFQEFREDFKEAEEKIKKLAIERQKKNSKRSSSESSKKQKKSQKKSSKHVSATSSKNSSVKPEHSATNVIKKKSSSSSSSCSSSSSAKSSKNSPGNKDFCIQQDAYIYSKPHPNITVTALDALEPQKNASKVPPISLPSNPPVTNPRFKPPSPKKQNTKSSSSSDHLILKGKNDAHEVIISIKDNKSNRRTNKDITITRPENYKDIESSSSEEDSVESISLTSSKNKSGSKIFESDKSDPEQGTVDKFLCINENNSRRSSKEKEDSRRSSKEKESQPSDPSLSEPDIKKNEPTHLDHKPNDKPSMFPIIAPADSTVKVPDKEKRQKSIKLHKVPTDSLSERSSSEKSESSKSSSSSVSEDSDSSSSFHYKRKEKKLKSVISVNSSDVSDNETDAETKFTQTQGQLFLKIVCNVLKINPFFNVPNGFHVEDMSKYLLEIVPKRSYELTEELFGVLGMVHEAVGKVALKEKEKWNIVMTSGLLPENAEITGEELAYALSRGFKYILLRKS